MPKQGGGQINQDVPLTPRTTQIHTRRVDSWSLKAPSVYRSPECCWEHEVKCIISRCSPVVYWHGNNLNISSASSKKNQRSDNAAISSIIKWIQQGGKGAFLVKYWLGCLCSHTRTRTRTHSHAVWMEGPNPPVLLSSLFYQWFWQL